MYVCVIKLERKPLKKAHSFYARSFVNFNLIPMDPPRPIHGPQAKNP